MTDYAKLRALSDKTGGGFILKALAGYVQSTYRGADLLTDAEDEAIKALSQRAVKQYDALRLLAEALPALLDEVSRLQDHVAQLVRNDDEGGMVLWLGEDVERLEKLLDRAREWMGDGPHKGRCRKVDGEPDFPCTCGLDTLRAEMP